MKSNIDMVLESVADELAASIRTEYSDLYEDYVIWIDCPYAEFVEFGSDPCIPKTVTPKITDPADGKEITETNYRIRDWAQTKFGLNNAQRCRRGDAIYHQVMDEGMPPQPFLRPALHYVSALFDNNGEIYLQEEEPTKRMAEDAVQRMIERLDTYGTTTTETLKRSIHYGPASMAPTGTFDTESVDKIPEEVWNDDFVDRHNVYRTNHGHI